MQRPTLAALAATLEQQLAALRQTLSLAERAFDKSGLEPAPFDAAAWAVHHARRLGAEMAPHVAVVAGSLEQLAQSEAA
jgi:hypothetical protein